jgi:hypothetical protein
MHSQMLYHQFKCLVLNRMLYHNDPKYLIESCNQAHSHGCQNEIGFFFLLSPFHLLLK